MEQIIAYIATAAIAFLIAKVPNALKYSKLAGEFVEFVKILQTSLADGQLTEAEVKTIAEDFTELKKLIKGA